jgi:hypothetical protein
LISCINTKYSKVLRPRKIKYGKGNGTKFKKQDRGLKGKKIPMLTTIIMVNMRYTFGLFLKGLPAVRIIKITRV